MCDMSTKIEIVKTSRVTGGMTPTIKFEFSDGATINDKGDGYGCEHEAEIYQVLISNWFNS